MCKNHKSDKMTEVAKTISIESQFEHKLDQEIVSIVDQVSLDNIKNKIKLLKLIS
jgi:hypothetical protein